MEKNSAKKLLGKVAEIQLVYHSRVPASERPTISSSEEAYRIFLSIWDEGTLELSESFHVLYLNRANQVLGDYHLSNGGITGTVADPRLVLAAALKLPCCALIMAHNHPSGNLRPSHADQELTQKIKNAAAFFDIKLLDHLIVTTDGYYSFADEGLI